MEARVMFRHDWFVIALSGATCSGKTTISNKLKDVLPNAVVINQDTYFLATEDERHTKIPELNHINFEILSSLDMARLLEDLHSVMLTRPDSLKQRELLKQNLLEKMGKDSEMTQLCDLARVPGFLIVEGFTILNDPELQAEFDLKFVITLDKETCWERRQLRCYEPPDVPGYFDMYVWPYYLKHLDEVKLSGQSICLMDGRDDISANVRTVLQAILSAVAARSV